MINTDYEPFDVSYVIDDSEVTCEVHKKLLEKSKLSKNQLAYSSPVQALKFLVRDIKAQKKILVLLDLEMPGVNGIDFLDIITGLEASNKQLSVYVVSSTIFEHLDNAVIYNSIIKRHFKKPLKPKDLSQVSVISDCFEEAVH
ncbi:response regulator [Flagellimonas sp. CMM7]|uniref:response regulator n=1 Tax=Flagellimonas sp. CMM7 TaxID=2654676 RepID=UPI0013D7B202|nr:response regulator [Flagellimonas sp. CMM7]UII79704.1 response regulator [Flagellimonas sp. CMM7]